MEGHEVPFVLKPHPSMPRLHASDVAKSRQRLPTHKQRQSPLNRVRELTDGCTGLESPRSASQGSLVALSGTQAAPLRRSLLLILRISSWSQRRDEGEIASQAEDPNTTCQLPDIGLAARGLEDAVIMKR
jgi:hypothetical protein